MFTDLFNWKKEFGASIQIRKFNFSFLSFLLGVKMSEYFPKKFFIFYFQIYVLLKLIITMRRSNIFARYKTLIKFNKLPGGTNSLARLIKICLCQADRQWRNPPFILEAL